MNDRRHFIDAPVFQKYWENENSHGFFAKIRVENKLDQTLEPKWVKRMNRLRQRFLEKSKFEKLVSDELEMHDGPNGTIE